jgi:hypothetical protein
MKGWFFKKLQEREFTIKEEQQIPYALELITHHIKYLAHQQAIGNGRRS